MNITADVVIDLQSGDTGKGKVAQWLARSGNYHYSLRFNGGSNAGHTIYRDDIKLVTHQIPVAITEGIPSIIGPGCVVNLDKLNEEIKDLTSVGIPVDQLLFIDKRAHLVLDEHIEEDSKDETIGTTRQGIGPAYRAKYNRKGLRAESIASPYITDIYDLLFNSLHYEVRVLCEGAQGFTLDIDWGDYPFVTTSHCVTGSVCLNGIPPQSIEKVYGVLKAYETYVGNKDFEPDDEDLRRLREFGNEFGATTGRPRQCNWLDLRIVERALRVNGVTHPVINKFDVLEKVGRFKLYDAQGDLREFETMDKLQRFVNDFFEQHFSIRTAIWSGSPVMSNA